MTSDTPSRPTTAGEETRGPGGILASGFHLGKSAKLEVSRQVSRGEGSSFETRNDGEDDVRVVPHRREGNGGIYGGGTIVDVGSARRETSNSAMRARPSHHFLREIFHNIASSLFFFPLGRSNVALERRHEEEEEEDVAPSPQDENVEEEVNRPARRVTGHSYSSHLHALSRGIHTLSTKGKDSMQVEMARMDLPRRRRRCCSAPPLTSRRRCLYMDRFVIKESSRAIRVWDYCMLILLFLLAWTIPFEIGVVGGLINASWGSIYELCVVSIFLIDSILHFFREARTATGLLIWHFYDIAMTYLSFWFWIDMLSCVPISTICYYAGWSHVDVGSAGNFNWLTLLNLLRLLRLLRIPRLLEDSVAITSLMLRANQNSLSAFRMLVTGLYVVHVFACFWSWMAIVESDYTWINKFVDYQITAVSPIGTLVSNVFDRYILSLYWASVTVVTVGYGDVTPYTVPEYWICTLCILVGAALWAWLIAQIVDMVVENGLQTSIFRQHLEALNQHLQRIHPKRPDWDTVMDQEVAKRRLEEGLEKKMARKRSNNNNDTKTMSERGGNYGMSQQWWAECRERVERNYHAELENYEREVVEWRSLATESRMFLRWRYRQGRINYGWNKWKVVEETLSPDLRARFSRYELQEGLLRCAYFSSCLMSTVATLASLITHRYVPKGETIRDTLDTPERQRMMLMIHFGCAMSSCAGYAQNPPGFEADSFKFEPMVLGKGSIWGADEVVLERDCPFRAFPHLKALTYLEVTVLSRKELMAAAAGDKLLKRAIRWRKLRLMMIWYGRFSIAQKAARARNKGVNGSVRRGSRDEETTGVPGGPNVTDKLVDSNGGESSKTELKMQSVEKEDETSEVGADVSIESPGVIAPGDTPPAVTSAEVMTAGVTQMTEGADRLASSAAAEEQASGWSARRRESESSVTSRRSSGEDDDDDDDAE